MMQNHSVVKQLHIVLIRVFMVRPLELRQELLPCLTGSQSLIPPIGCLSGPVHGPEDKRKPELHTGEIFGTPLEVDATVLDDFTEDRSGLKRQLALYKSRGENGGGCPLGLNLLGLFQVTQILVAHSNDVLT